LVHFAFIFLSFFSFIDRDTACANTTLNWTCPGGYIDVRSATWDTVDEDICVKISDEGDAFSVTAYMKNKCDNKSSCSFTVNDTSVGVSCGGKCSGLDYIYKCLSKSLVLRIFFFIINQLNREILDTLSKRYTTEIPFNL
jgi:hypothetical protein